MLSDVFQPKITMFVITIFIIAGIFVVDIILIIAISYYCNFD